MSICFAHCSLKETESMNNSSLILYMSLKIPLAQHHHQHRDDHYHNDCINRSCLVCFACMCCLSLQISLSYAIFMICLFVVFVVCPIRCQKRGATFAISHVHSLFDGCWKAEYRTGLHSDRKRERERVSKREREAKTPLWYSTNETSSCL